MAKTKISKTKPEGFLTRFNIEEFLPQKYHVLAVILFIIILFLIFLYPLYFGNQTFQSADIIASASIRSYVDAHEGGYTLWNPYIFCGMPAYSIGIDYKWFNLIYVLITEIRSAFITFFTVQYSMWTFYLIVLGITMFFLVKHLTKNTLVSLFSAAAASFSTGIIVSLFIGHVTKLTSIAFYPLILLVLLKFQEKIKLIDILILIIALQLMLQGFHVQIIFYFLFAFGIYFLFYFISALIQKNIFLRNQILKSFGTFLFALIIALLIQLDNITQIYEYTQYSTRGQESITDITSGKSEQKSSEFYEYHTNWSFSPGEVLTFIVPSFYGFGASTYQGPLTNNQPVEVNTYFGQMPFVDVAQYMGILVFFLGLFAIFTRWKEPFVKFLTILSVISLLISFGKTFPVLFDLLFYNLPYFNKFRVPSMILVLVQLSFPILAGLGLMKIISLKGEKDKSVFKLIKNSAIVFSALFILFLLFSSALSTWFIERVNEYAAGIAASQPQLSQQFKALSEYMADFFISDLLIGFFFLSLTFWFSFAYLNQKISADIITIIIILFTVADLWRIDDRGAKYIDNPETESLFKQPAYVTAIKNQNDKDPFRILNIKQDGSLGSLNRNSNFNAYFLLEDFYGYSAVKPRAYQNIMDIVGPVNQNLWRMLNVKYLISNQQIPFPDFIPIMNNENDHVYINNNALPRVYFVNKVEVKEPLEILNEIKLNSFDPKNVAFVEENISVVAPDSSAYSRITNYKNELLEAEVYATGNNFLFFGNTYLPTGWKAEIDGTEAKIFRTNHGYMGIVVPEGKHTITFKYAPVSFFISKYVVLILSSLTLLGLFTILILKIRKVKPEIA